MDTLIQCEICVEPFDSTTRYPSTLMCGHTFCLECVSKMSERKQKIVRLEVDDRGPRQSYARQRPQRQIVKLIDRIVVLQCPVCRDVTPFKPHVEPRKNYLVLELINALTNGQSSSATRNTPQLLEASMHFSVNDTALEAEPNPVAVGETPVSASLPEEATVPIDATIEIPTAVTGSDPFLGASNRMDVDNEAAAPQNASIVCWLSD